MQKRLVYSVLSVLLLSLCVGFCLSTHAAAENLEDNYEIVKGRTERIDDPYGFYDMYEYYILKDKDGNIIISDDNYCYMRFWGEYLVVAVREGNQEKYGLIDINENVIIPFGKYDSLCPYRCDILNCNLYKTFGYLLYFEENGFGGLMASDFSIVIPPQYDDGYDSGWAFNLDHLRGAIFRVTHPKTGKHGIYKVGEGEIIPTIYDVIHTYGRDTLIVTLGGYKGLIDDNGNVILPIKYARIDETYQGFHIAGQEKGEDDLRIIEEKRIAAGLEWVHGQLDYNYGLIDSHGNVIIPFEYDYVKFDKKAGVVHYGDWNGKVKKQADDKIAGATVTTYYYDTESIPLSELENMSPIFSDVSITSYYNVPVRWAVEKGITTGTSATTFSPDQTCTNAQILTFLWRAAGAPEPIVSNPFTNITDSDYFYKAALWTYEKGMVSGNVFYGDALCTRSQTVMYLWQAAGMPAVGNSAAFTDVSADAVYAQAVAWAVEKGVTTGTSASTFSPESTCTRGQIVTFLYRAFAE